MDALSCDAHLLEATSVYSLALSGAFHLHRGCLPQLQPFKGATRWLVFFGNLSSRMQSKLSVALGK